MKKFISVICVMTILTTLFSVNVFAASVNIGETKVSNIPIIEQKNFPNTVENILMNKAVITGDEYIGSDIVNKVISSNVKERQTQLSDTKETIVENVDASIVNKTFRLDEIYCTKDYVYACSYDNDVFAQYLFFPDGTVRKCVSYNYNDIIYVVINNNNASIEKGVSTELEVETSLSSEELSRFYDLLEEGEVQTQDSYSIEYVREKVGSSSGHSIDMTSMYANTECPTLTAYAPGGNYTSYSNTKPISAYYIGTYCTNVSGLSEYNNGSNTAQIREYDTRKSYVESYERKSLFDYGTDVMAIVAFSQLIFSKTITALNVAGVVIDAASRITSPTIFYAEQEYIVSAYRESQIYDYTKENAYVELPQLYSQMAIGITYGTYSGGYYTNASWQVITRPKFSIPSIGVDDSTQQQYCDYVADIYYRNCVIKGKWIHGRTAYGGLGG